MWRGNANTAKVRREKKVVGKLLLLLLHHLGPPPSPSRFSPCSPTWFPHAWGDAPDIEGRKQRDRDEGTAESRGRYRVEPDLAAGRRSGAPGDMCKATCRIRTVLEQRLASTEEKELVRAVSGETKGDRSRRRRGRAWGPEVAG